MGFDIAAYVDAAGEVVGLTLDAEAKVRVVAQLQIAQSMAAQVMGFPLPPDAEAASVFTP